MTWHDLPDGLVDSFRKEAFSLNGEGLIIVKLSGGSFGVSSYRDSFFAKLLERLAALIASHTKADVLVMTGRMDKPSGEKLSPQVQVRLYGV